jgi:pyruvate dehydrogenase (quinone)
VVPDSEELTRAAQLINAGRKVALLVGRGCLEARAEVLELAERVGAPVAKALLGKAAIPDDHPHCVGGIGLLGTTPAAEAMKECDTLIMAGTNFPYLEFLPKPGAARVVQIDLDPARIGSRQPVEVGLVGDCRAVLRALLPLVQRKSDRSFLQTAQEHMRDWNEVLETRGTRDSMPMKPQVAARALNGFLDENAIIACDCGTVTTWAARHIKMRGDMMFSVSGSLATMATGLPYAIAAAIAYPGRQVVAILGDGGFTMLMGELATIVKYKLPIKILVIKNNSLGEIKWEQLAMEGNPEFGVELQPIDFPAIARGFGVPGFALSVPGEAQAVVAEAFAQPGPALIEATVDPNEPPLPGQITTRQALQFAKALVRGEKERFTIMKGILVDKVREVV